MGHPIAIFAAEDRRMAIHLMCSLCKEVLKDAVRLGCGREHEVCADCTKSLNTWLGRDCCPDCYSQVVPDDAQPSLSTRRLVDSLNILCSKPACSQVYPLGSRPMHLAIRCDGRRIECACKDYFEARFIKAHQGSCGAVLVQCKLGGADCALVKRGEMATHEAQCAFHKCQFAGEGCPFRGTQTAIVDHEASYCAPLHGQLSNASMELDAVTVDSKDREEQLTTKVKRLKRKLLELETASEASRMGQEPEKRPKWEFENQHPEKFLEVLFDEIVQAEDSEGSQTDIDEDAWDVLREENNFRLK